MSQLYSRVTAVSAYPNNYGRHADQNEGPPSDISSQGLDYVGFSELCRPDGRQFPCRSRWAAYAISGRTGSTVRDVVLDDVASENESLVATQNRAYNQHAGHSVGYIEPSGDNLVRFSTIRLEFGTVYFRFNGPAPWCGLSMRNVTENVDQIIALLFAMRATRRRPTQSFRGCSALLHDMGLMVDSLFIVCQDVRLS